MVTDSEKKSAKPKTGKVPAVKKVAPAKEATAKPTAKKAASGGQLKVTQIGSPIARHESQRATLVGLGLNKMHRSRVLEDTPNVRGMVRKVHHLVKIENVG